MTQIKKFTLAISEHGTIGIINSDSPIDKNGSLVWTGIVLRDNAYRVRKEGMQPHIIAYNVISNNQGDEWESENPVIIGQLFDDHVSYLTVEHIPLENTVENIQLILNENEYNTYKKASDECQERLDYFREQAWG